MNFLFAFINLVALLQAVEWWREVRRLRGSCAELNPYLLAAKEGKRVWTTILIMLTVLHVLAYVSNEI